LNPHGEAVGFDRFVAEIPRFQIRGTKLINDIRRSLRTAVSQIAGPSIDIPL
jgi:hypothetical protein